MRTTGHPFADQWNHNSHYYPLLRAAVPDTATRVLDIGCAWDRLPMWRYRVTWTKPGREPA